MTIKPSSQTVPPLKCGFSFRIVCSSAAALLGLSLASAQTTTKPDEEPVKMDQFVVQGFRQSLAASLDAKRASGANIDVITAEDVGKFPDTNLAESLSHIPGVTIDRLFGDGERVSILGTDPNLNRTLLNGQPIATADWYILDQPSRQFNYVLIAPEVIGQAEVYRTWEPRLLEGSIGGTIIVHTIDPLQGREVNVAATVSESDNSLGKKSEPSFSGTISWHNKERTFGLLLGAQDQKEFIRRDGIETLGIVGNYVDAKTGLVANNTFQQSNVPQAGTPGMAPTGPGNFIAPEVVNTALFEQLRHRQGGNFAAVYKPSQTFSAELTGLYVKENMNNMNSSALTMETQDSGSPAESITGAPLTTVPPPPATITNPSFANGIMNASTFNGSHLELDEFARKAIIKTQHYNLTLRFTQDDFKLVGTLGYTRATGGTQGQAYRGVNVGFGPVPTGGTAPYSSSYTVKTGSDFASYTVNNPSANYALTNDVSLSGGNDGGWGSYVQEPETDQEKWAQMDLEVPLHNSVLKNLLVGFRSSEHDTSQTTYAAIMFNDAGQRNVLNYFQAAPSNFLSGLPGVTASMSNRPVPTFDGIWNEVLNKPATAANVTSGNWPGLVLGQTFGQYVQSHPNANINGWLVPVSNNAATGPTFQANETVNATYLEAQFSSGRLSGNFGARLVQTRTSGWSMNLSGLPQNFTTSGTGPYSDFTVYGTPVGTVIPTAGFGSAGPLAPGPWYQYHAAYYNGWASVLPNGVWTPSEVALTETPIRQSQSNTYNDVLPALNVAYDVAQNQVVRFAMASTMARPNLIQEFNYTSLYPNTSPGVFGGNGVGGNSNIEPYRSTNLDLDWEYYFAKNSYLSADLFYKDISNYIVNETVPELHTNQNAVIDQWFYITRPQNGGKATSKGVALSYQQEWASGLGIQANYTRLWAEGATGPLPYASKNQINVGPYFENNYGLLRLTYSWRDDYATGSFNGSSTVYTRPYTSLDATANINLGKGVALVLTATNILNEKYQQYYSNPNGGGKLFADAYKVGTTYRAGIHVRF